MPGQAEATVQFIQHGLWVLPQLGEHHQAMEPQVCGFIDYIAVITADLRVLGRNDGLDGFFAEFFQNLVQALVVQAAT